MIFPQGFFMAGLFSGSSTMTVSIRLKSAKIRMESIENFPISVSKITLSEDSISARFKFACTAVTHASP